MDERNDAHFDGSGNAAGDPAEPDRFDLLLDRALTTYTAGEPRPGFAARVLASTSAARYERPRAVHAWAIAASGWAVAVAAVILWFRAQPVEIVVGHRSPAPEMAQSAPPVLHPAPAPATGITAPLPPPRGRAAGRIHTQRTGQTPDVQPIAFDPIVIAPIRIGAMN